MSDLTPPLKWHGGKSYLANDIIALMPPRSPMPNAPLSDDTGWLHYVEPYAGGLAVLLAMDPEGISEVVNDMNCELTNFWLVMQNPALFDHFWRHVEALAFSQVEWRDAGKPLEPDETYPTYGGVNVVRAIKFFVLCRQSLAGRMKHFAPLSRNRTRARMNEQASAWLSCVDGLPAVHARLRRVVILNDDALSVIRQQDGKRTLFYCDPPYLSGTRTAPDVYQHEMTYEQHAALLETLRCIDGRFLLSGYRSELYDRYATANHWQRHDFDLPNNAAGGEEKRRMVECVWTNF